jgi:hypothetical protein
MCPQVQALSLRLIRPLLQGEPESSEGEFTCFTSFTFTSAKVLAWPPYYSFFFSSKEVLDAPPQKKHFSKLKKYLRCHLATRFISVYLLY